MHSHYPERKGDNAPIYDFESTGADTVYRIGSISKPITTTAVMQLAEQKSINRCKTICPNFLFRVGFKLRLIP
ncbi:MAG: beta-lactamase family protein [Gammaproteobacteria bacterium]|nr:beta-lactamase family protein [Gammaproteobacteria bacterium]